MIKEKKIAFVIFMLLLILTGFRAVSQIKGESGLKWYSWNASGGFMLPLDPFHSNLGDGAQHAYKFSGNPGFTFSLAKPIGLQFIVGADLEDLRIDGKVANYLSSGTDSSYKARFRTYGLFCEYYFFPNGNINPFVSLKAGFCGINRAVGKRDISRAFPPDLWNLQFTVGTGVTYHVDPNFSINLYGELTPVSNAYLQDLFVGLNKSTIAMARIVLTVTGHTDIRVFFPFFRGREFSNKYKPDTYLPFFNRKKNR
jgi:opacity protein-like surface antigen